MNLSDVNMPERPESLIEAERRRSEIRRQRHTLEARLKSLETELSLRAMGSDDDKTVAALVSGDIAELGRDNLPFEAGELRRNLGLVVQADQELARLVAKERERFSNRVAAAYRPAHRAAVRKILEALETLVEANQAEELIHLAVPGLKLPFMAFPNAGKFGCNGGPAQFWKEFALRTYPDLLADESKPAGLAPKKRGLFASRTNGAAEPMPLVAKALD